ncbi:hypothetical protein SLOPH_521, partial [Spraguea lophii 42_110]
MNRNNNKINNNRMNNNKINKRNTNKRDNISLKNYNGFMTDKEKTFISNILRKNIIREERIYKYGIFFGASEYSNINTIGVIDHNGNKGNDAEKDESNNKELKNENNNLIDKSNILNNSNSLIDKNNNTSNTKDTLLNNNNNSLDKNLEKLIISSHKKYNSKKKSIKLPRNTTDKECSILGEIHIKLLLESMASHILELKYYKEINHNKDEITLINKINGILNSTYFTLFFKIDKFYPILNDIIKINNLYKDRIKDNNRDKIDNND